MAPVIQELRKSGIDYKVCNTGQHKEMLDQVLEFFEIVPAYDLEVMKHDHSLNEISSLILTSIEKVLKSEKPDLVLVQGDTTTAFVASLAAFNNGIKVGHIEAGLRTYDKMAPFPEEVNRQLISKIADFHFAPTDRSGRNLLNESIGEDSVYVTGNTVIDALNWAEQKIEIVPPNQEILKIKGKLDSKKKLILVTGHRRESFGSGLQSVCEALIELSQEENIELIYPVHLNPNVSGPINNALGKTDNIFLVPPVSYPTMIWLMKHCSLIISDSGGIQEEAPAFSKMVLVTREKTERMEGVESGFSKLVGTDKEKIVSEAKIILKNNQPANKLQNPYGNGKAAEEIVRIILNTFSVKEI